MTDHLTPTVPSDRGFRWMPALRGAYRGSSDEVRIIESSLAEGPHLGVCVVGIGYPADARTRAAGGEDVQDVGAVEVHVPLDAATAWQLKEQIEWLLEHHYQGDARPAR